MKNKSQDYDNNCLGVVNGELSIVERPPYTPPTHLSPSQLNLYLKSQKEYYNRYILGIEDSEDKLSYAIGRNFEKYLFNQEYDLSECYKGAEPQTKLLKKFKAMKEAIMAQELVAMEYETQVEFLHRTNDLPIKGFLDYLGNEKIIELKTYSNEYQFKQMLDKYKRQLLTYALAFPNLKYYLLAVEVSEYPSVKVYELTKETIERETPILIAMYQDLQNAKDTGLFDIEPKKVEIEKL